MKCLCSRTDFPAFTPELGNENHKPQNVGHHLKASSFLSALLWWKGGFGVKASALLSESPSQVWGSPWSVWLFTNKGPVAILIQPGSGVLLSRLSTCLIYGFILSFPVLKVMAQISFLSSKLWSNSLIRMCNGIWLHTSGHFITR